MMMNQQQHFRIGFGSRLTPVVKYLLIANGAFFVLQTLLGPSQPLVRFLALFPAHITERFAIYELVSYMFLHGSFWHLFFNMFALLIFGCEVELLLGSKRFLQFYFFTGIFAGLCHLLFNWGEQVPVIGASGAIYGVLVAFAVFFPNRVITLLLFFILPIQMRARTLVLVFVGLSVFMGLRGEIFGTADNVAHLAHLGGAVAGYLFLRYRALMQRGLRSISNTQRIHREKKEQQQNMFLDERRREIDTILDRINKVGYDNITQKEKETLKKASDYLQKYDKSS
ncbi:MAG: rhomboid family intramembrane serine protease [candidate division KSB1 bacterium]|nr:rhomboid family intramembrane serine protease [candidate division KSB1 bacterium]